MYEVILVSNYFFLKYEVEGKSGTSQIDPPEKTNSKDTNLIRANLFAILETHTSRYSEHGLHGDTGLYFEYFCKIY